MRRRRIVGAEYGSRAPTQPRRRRRALPGTAPCPCQRYDAQSLKYLTFTIVISERQVLIMLDNNKARVSVGYVHCHLQSCSDHCDALPFTSTELI